MNNQIKQIGETMDKKYMQLKEWQDNAIDVIVSRRS